MSWLAFILIGFCGFFFPTQIADFAPFSESLIRQAGLVGLAMGVSIQIIERAIR